MDHRFKRTRTDPQDSYYGNSSNRDDRGRDGDRGRNGGRGYQNDYDGRGGNSSYGESSFGGGGQYNNNNDSRRDDRGYGGRDNNNGYGGRDDDRGYGSRDNRSGGYGGDSRGYQDSSSRSRYDQDRRGGGYDQDRRGGGYDQDRRGGDYGNRSRDYNSGGGGYGGRDGRGGYGGGREHGDRGGYGGPPGGRRGGGGGGFGPPGGRYGDRGGGRGGGRGYGGRGKPAPKFVGPCKTVTNILLASPTDCFQFHQYTFDAKDRNNRTVESAGRRKQLLSIALDQLFADKSEKEKKSFLRQIFFSGTYFFSSNLLDGLGELPQKLLDGTQGDGDTLSIVRCQSFTAPSVLVPPSSEETKETCSKDPSSFSTINIEFRCANCTSVFKDKNGILSHCQNTGHKPVNDLNLSDYEPASRTEFAHFCNIVLQRAMSERMARWGRHYIDPTSYVTPRDRRGDELGVDVFQAYSVEFNVGKPSNDENEKLHLMLTVDLTAKIIRTRSLLMSIYGTRNPNTTRFSDQEINEAKRRWIGQTVISKIDKKCHAIHDLVFEESAETLPVGDLNMSHAEYFRVRKNTTLEYPRAVPMVAVMGRNQQLIHLPPELICADELEDEIKVMLPKIASFNPETRNDAIEKVKKFLIPGAQKSRDQGGLLPALGIVLQEDRLKLTAEVLATPEVVTPGGKINTERHWAPQLARAKFNVEPKEVVTLNVIVIHHRNISWERPYGDLVRMINGHESTFRFPDQPIRVIHCDNDLDRHWGAVERNFDISEDLPPNLFVVDMTKPRTVVDQAYPVVKKMFASGGILSQFINFKKCNHCEGGKKSPMILGAIARQILNKVGVVIWWTNIPKTLPLPAVYIGVDVFHAARQYDPNIRKRVAKPSVAAVVMQVIKSPTESCWYSETFKRDAGDEYNLGSALEETLSRGLERLSIEEKPKSCILWRDGVGDAAIEPTAEQEYPAIYRGLGENIPMAMIICQKRISTKFFDANNGGALPQGLLVQGVSNVDRPTFYLQGTSPPYSTPKPVRFIIVRRDQGLEDVSLADLTWQSCHDYPNWAGLIKVPAVTQLAHALAEHAGNFDDSGTNIDHAKYTNKLYFL